MMTMMIVSQTKVNHRLNIKKCEYDDNDDGYADDGDDEDGEKKEDLVEASGLPSENWWSSTKEGGKTVVNLV